MPEPTRYEDAKPWNYSPPSTPGSGRVDAASPPLTPSTPLTIDRRARRSITSLVSKAPHYTVRSHASMTDVYGFGQDLAWKEAHYEHPLPAHASTSMHPDIDITPAPPSMHSEIDVVPPTPPSEINHTMTPAMPLMRNPSTASSVNSEYSTASMALSRSVPHDINEEQDMPPEGQGSRRLV
ncbi:hypothetical protein B0H12DRAFT_1068973 [Mycena haematopus]|nr:hypothetical protein B0H12DRAFT_1068973 [Mycena haematopus]